MSFRRRKSLLLFLAIAGCLVYYNWFYQPPPPGTVKSQLDEDSDELFIHRLQQKNAKPRPNVVYADSDTGRHQRRDTAAAAADQADQAISEKDLKHVAHVLHAHKAFLLDVDVLGRVHFIDKHLETLAAPAEVKAYKLNVLETFARLKQSEKKTPLITYGVHLDSLASLNDVSPSPVPR